MTWLINRFLIWWLHTGRYRWSKMRRRLFERSYLSINLPEANSLEEIHARLRQVKWTKDSLWHLYDSISYPQMTWSRKKDDCDGFSSLAAALLSHLNPDYRPVLVTAVVHPVKFSHTVCAFQGEGDLCFFDNDRLRCESCHTPSDVVVKITGARELVCWDVRDPATLKLIEFHRG